MQSNKASKKTRKAADAAASNPEPNAAEGTQAPHAARSSKSKMQETNEVASSSHRHKIVSPVPEGIVESTSAETEVRDLDNRAMAATAGGGVASAPYIADPVGQVIAGERNRAAEIADLAYSYFAARGYQHGHAEQDWLRAEHELQSKRSA